jgi:hypothetical protein
MQNAIQAASRVLVGIAVFAAGLGTAAANTAGAFQFVAGEVKVTLASGAERPARKGTPVDVGDTITTAKNAMAQIKMGDGAIVVVQPDSRVTVAEYHYSGHEDGSENVRFRLDQGGFRAITGAIGHTHKNNYLIETPIAHIGVRGTDHETYYFPAGDADTTKPGVYNKVNVGRTYIRTESGEVEVGPNQVGYAASGHDRPALLPSLPGFFNRAFEPKQVLRGGGATQLASFDKLPVVQTVSTADGILLSPATIPPATAGSMNGSTTGSVVGYTSTPNAFSGVNLAIAPNGATLANTGSDPAFGVSWGSWQGGAPTVAGAATTGAVNFAESTQLTSSAQLAALSNNLVTATYNYVGGPAPTNNVGTQGTINSLTVGVNFSTQTISNYAVNASVAGNTWTGNGSGTFAQFSGTSGIALTGSCASGCSGGSMVTAHGTANGAFVGRAAEKMITSFGLKAGNDAISGAAYLSR